MAFYRKFLLFFSILIFNTAKSQQPVPASYVEKATGKHLWGYADRFYLDYAIPAKFDSTISFADGAGRIILNGKYGFTDNKGKLFIPAKYDAASDFSEGMAAVTLDGKTFYIDKQGVDVFKKTYSKGYLFSGGLAMVENEAGNFGFINNKGLVVIPFDYKKAWSFSNGIAPVLQVGETVWKAIDIKGKVVFAFNDNVNYALGSFKDGLVQVYRKDVAGDEHYDFVNEKGAYICKAPYLETRPFNNGAAIITKQVNYSIAKSKQSIQYGLISKNGREIVPADYVCLTESSAKGIYYYGEPVASGYGCSGYGLMDGTGAILTAAKFSEFTQLNDTTFLCRETNNSPSKYLLLSTKGKELTSTRQYQKEFMIAGKDTLLYLFSKFNNGTISMSLYNIHTGMMKENSENGIIVYPKEKIVLSAGIGAPTGAVMTTSGKMLADNVETRMIYTENMSTDGVPFILLKNKTESKFRLFNLNTAKYVSADYDFGTTTYQYSKHYSDGMLLVKQKDFWGYIDSSGALKIPCQFKTAKEFQNGWAVVQKKLADGSGSPSMVYINKAGKELAGIKADYLNAADYSEGFTYYVKFAEPGKASEPFVYYINTSGKILYKSEGTDFFKHGKFSNGMAAVCNSEGYFGFINTKGQLVIPCQYKVPPQTKDEDDEDEDLDMSKEPSVIYIEFGKNGTVAVEKDGKKIWIDKTGKQVK